MNMICLNKLLKDKVEVTNEAKRRPMRTPVPKSLNILYFIPTFTSEMIYYSLKFKSYGCKHSQPIYH